MTAIIRRADKLVALAQSLQAVTDPRLARWQADPATLMLDAGLAPDPWQSHLLRQPSPQTLLNCSRQSGKSTVAAALALQAAILEAPALVLLLSPTLRQSSELFLKIQ